MNSRHSYFLIFLFFFASIIPGIFAAPCIEEIMSGLPDGAIINPQQYNLKFEAPKGKSVVIEVIQGGYFDTRKYCINVSEEPVNIFGWLNTRTAPLQVICYDAIDPSMSGNVIPGISSENGCWQKGKTLQTYTLFIDGKESGIEESIRNIGYVISQTSLLNSTIPTDYNVNMSTTAAVTKEYYLFNDSNYTFPLGILFILIGAFLFFATFFNNNIKEFI